MFVSYAGLTKVSSVWPRRSRTPTAYIPLGMMLSLGTATAIYCLGVFIMVAVLEPVRVAQRPDAGGHGPAAVFFDWLPGGAGLVLIVVAAVAAFASTGNAGILSASRYPLAMARDGLVTRRLAALGASGDADGRHRAHVGPE